MDTFVVKVRAERTGSCVSVARLDNAEAALGVALNLHQLSNEKHFINVIDSRGNEILTLMRVESVKFQLPKK